MTKELFFETMINNFKDHFLKERKKEFTNQTVESCMDIYNVCKEVHPDSVIEIGTNYGASTLALSLSMKDMNKDLSNILTIDLHHTYWLRTRNVQELILKEEGLKIERVKFLSKNFNEIDPMDIVEGDKKVLIFYDIHDHDGPWSQKLLDSWIPLIKNGAFMIHDISPVPDNFEFKIDKSDRRPRSKIKYLKTNKSYAGFAECGRIINWANKNEIIIKDFNGGVYFIK